MGVSTIPLTTVVLLILLPTKAHSCSEDYRKTLDFTKVYQQRLDSPDIQYKDAYGTIWLDILHGVTALLHCIVTVLTLSSTQFLAFCFPGVREQADLQEC